MPEQRTKDDEILDSLHGVMDVVSTRLDKVDGQFTKSREETAELKGDMNHQFSEVRTQLDGMQNQLDRIEHLILEEHARRIEALERKVGLTA